MKNSDLLFQKQHGGWSRGSGLCILYRARFTSSSLLSLAASPDLQLSAQNMLLVTACLESEKPSASHTKLLPIRFPEI